MQAYADGSLAASLTSEQSPPSTRHLAPRLAVPCPAPPRLSLPCLTTPYRTVPCLASGAVYAVKSFDTLKCARDTTVCETRDNEIGVLRLLREHMSDGVDHPYIASMVDELGADGSISHQHAVLEYAEGGSLHRFLHASKAPLPHSAAASASRQVACALAHLHGLQVAHRDLKTANVLIVQPPRADDLLATLHLKLCDFGFSCICADRRLKAHCGTPAYLAPEIVTPAEARAGYLGRPVDMWALGCMLFELLHRGRPAFRAEEGFELQGRIRRCNYGPCEKDVPQDARSLLHGLLIAPAERRLTAAQVLEAPWHTSLPAAPPPPLHL